MLPALARRAGDTLSMSRRTVGRELAPEICVLGYFNVPIGWGELLKRTAKETSADNGLGLAAQLAYYFFLALFPALLFFIALASFFISPQVIDQVVDMLAGVAPAAVVEIIREQLQELSKSQSGGLMTFGVAAAIWSSSAAMVGLIEALNRAYDVEDARPWWKQRMIAILLTVGVAIFILLSITLVITGPQLAEYVARQVGLGAAFEWTWKVLQWPLVLALIVTAFGLIYYAAPHVDQDFVWLTPGSVLAATLWLAGSVAFRFYVVNFGSYNATYGAIGGVMVLMLWLYLSGLAIIVGAEMNAEIERELPHGREPGVQATGQLKKIGPRAARDFEARRRRPPEPAGGPAAKSQALIGPDGRTLMAQQEPSIVELLRTAIRDAQDLVRKEVALAKAELREEGRRLASAIALLAGAAVMGVLALVFLLTTAALGLADALEWAPWAGYAVVTGLVLVIALVLALVGRSRIAAARPLPRTMETLKENSEWIRARTS